MDQNINNRAQKTDFMRPCSVNGVFADASPHEELKSKGHSKSRAVNQDEYIFKDEDITIEGIRQQIELVHKAAYRLHYYLDDIDKLRKY